ncbi:MAG: hypothetical protein ACM3ML_05125 [Micromonosporaceae bacterium]
MISAVVLTLQTAVVIATGITWLYLLQFPLGNLVLSVLFAGTARTHRPLVAQLATEVVALRRPGAHHPGPHRFFRAATWLWAGIFFVLTAGQFVVSKPRGIRGHVVPYQTIPASLAVVRPVTQTS